MNRDKISEEKKTGENAIQGKTAEGPVPSLPSTTSTAWPAGPAGSSSDHGSM